MLGRGLQQDQNGNWVLTKLFEVCDEKGAHLPTALPEDDDNPNSCIGGSELNILAGVELYKYFHPAMTVFAYGMRSNYLRNINAPSECVVGTKKFLEIAREEGETPEVEIFREGEWNQPTSGTDAEIHNIFSLVLAPDLQIANVAIVTVAVHVPRTALMVQGHMQNPEFAGRIFPQIYVAEQILETADPEQYAGLWARSIGSQSFTRTFQREIGFGGVYPRGGVNAYFAGIRQTDSSKVPAAAGI
ncbi:MAG TPA: hypothetical protein VIJ29_01065 [Candidatus Paceibacterota bacterium]